MAVMTAAKFAAKARNIAIENKTLYVLGCFGSPMNASNKLTYSNNYSYNMQADRKAKIMAATADTFGFDCVCLIKGILWGWTGDKNKAYGGAVYRSNGVPDVDDSGIMDYCTSVSTNFSNIAIGEVLHMKGHVGIYIGNGLAVECTPIWKDGVQITAVGNIGKKSGYNTRTWTDHGKLKFIDYSAQEEQESGEFDVAVIWDVYKGCVDGGHVKSVQTLLNQKNNAGLVVDGNCGKNTDAAIRAWQKKYGLYVDGVCGKNTWFDLITRNVG